ncbi:hypothetical protein ACO1KB_04485 [Leptospira interrogans serovar Szwajizak]|uniref:hypothetical protein n=1 Tax=Leptospira interrogans TaxID=173 RepID=UPI00034AAD8A|nr:hypothetical protein [Leptospira interrogans]
MDPSEQKSVFSKELLKQTQKDILKSFRYFSDPEYTGENPALPVSQIIFGAPGPVVNPPSYEFMGYGNGPEGIAFEETGGFDLSEILNSKLSNDEEEKLFEIQFKNACELVTQILKQIANSEEFQKIPKIGPIVFRLSIESQSNRVLGRIHPDGTFEDPPVKK